MKAMMSKRLEDMLQTEEGRAKLRQQILYPKDDVVVIPRRTEAEWREEFENYYDDPRTPSDPFMKHAAWRSWLAALRHVGAIRPDEKEGV